MPSWWGGGYLILNPEIIIQDKPHPYPNPDIYPINSANYYEVDTTGWQTYTNSRYGFEFRYPKEWTFISGFVPGGVVKDDYFKDASGRILSVIPFLGYSKVGFGNIENIEREIRSSYGMAGEVLNMKRILDNESTVGYSVLWDLAGGGLKGYFAKKVNVSGDYFPIINLYPRQDIDRNIFNDILSTFKFANQ